MTRSKFIKALTLCSSVLLVLFFLLYRAGVFDNRSNDDSYLQAGSNGSVLTNTMADTTKKIKDSSDMLLFSSSKSMVLMEPKLPVKDSVKGKHSAKKKPEMFSSSKSAIIFTPLQDRVRGIDSIQPVHDTAKNQKRRK